MSLFGKPAELKDIEVANVQSDGISALAWSPVADLVAVASWNNEVRIYEIGPGGQNQGRAQYAHEGPVLCVTWSKDGTKVLSGGADNAGRIYDLATGQTSQFAAHDAPVRCVKWIDNPGQPMAATASWDKTLKYWNMTSPQPVATVQLPERAYTMDVAYPLMVIGCAERHVLIFNLNNPTTPFKTIPSPLKMQTRSIACFPDGTGYSISSIEGRVAVQHVDDSKVSQNFSFKCHRADQKGPGFKTGSQAVYAVNAIAGHPFGTWATAGSDGVINQWDYISRTRLKTWADLGGPVTACAFSHTGQFMAYAVSYDWSKGHGGNVNVPNKVMIHVCQEDEVKRRPKK